MLCALIMAGGKGTRFWPKSTEEKPKQFINLVGEETMLQMTVNRLKKLIPIENIFICTGDKYAALVKEQIKELPEKNIILEPFAKNTAPCILLSSLYINQLYENANVVVVPSDHIIKNNDMFLSNISTAHKFVKKEKSAIVTIGIVPTRPETGYGYIKKSDIILNDDIIKVEKFVEKPSLEVAEDYLKSGKYLWNAGMFIFNTKSMINEFQIHLESIYTNLIQLPSIDDNNYYSVLNEKYNECDKISIDYGIIEKSSNVYTILADFIWDDIGTWSSLERYMDKDENNNIVKGEVLLDNSNNCIVYGNGKKIILVNINDIFCIDSDDAIIVGKKENINDLKKYME